MAEQEKFSSQSEAASGENSQSRAQYVFYELQGNIRSMLKCGRRMTLSQDCHYVFGLKSLPELEDLDREGKLGNQIEWLDIAGPVTEEVLTRAETKGANSEIVRTVAVLQKILQSHGQQLNEILNETALLRRAAQAREEQQQAHMKEIKDELARMRQQLEEGHRGKTEISVPGPTIPEGESTMSQESKSVSQDVDASKKTKRETTRHEMETPPAIPSDQPNELEQLKKDIAQLQRQLQDAREQARQEIERAKNDTEEKAWQEFQALWEKHKKICTLFQKQVSQST